MQLLIYCKYINTFRVSIATNIRSAKSVNAASDTGHCNGANTFLQRGPIRTRWRKVVALIL